eukprot:TRINITY_DN9711_c0_g1_i1.p18 TRINITY_DN9711_c0_g1~~TRINITY_DN9711_c0_g1_i1.p18  ORF type:complete len:102 (-),score=0.03 TRINITY_DN9711_c0_g1_i1:792-1097(-)
MYILLPEVWIMAEILSCINRHFFLMQTKYIKQIIPNEFVRVCVCIFVPVCVCARMFIQIQECVCVYLTACKQCILLNESKFATVVFFLILIVSQIEHFVHN